MAVPVVGPDGRNWPSMSAAARDLGCRSTALYYYAVWQRDHWCLTAYPDPRNCGRKQGGRQYRRRRTEPKESI